MFISRLAATAVITYVFAAQAVSATTLTLDQALALARERSPALVSARARIDEADARARAAGVLLSNNPVLDGAVGNRVTPGEDNTTDLRIGLSQTFAMGGGRGARVAAGKADFMAAVAEADFAVLDLLRDVEASFQRSLYEEERVRLATASESLVVDVVRIAERRFAGGDVARLDVNVAKTALARARAERVSAEAARDVALAQLRVVLGMAAGDTLAVGGELSAPSPLALQEMLSLASSRPDVRALDAEIKRADAEARMGGARRWPELSLGAAWEREETSEITLGEVELSIPIFDHGQGLRDESRARSRRLQGELAALRKSVVVEVESAYSVYEKSVVAVQALDEVMPLVRENENLVRRGYETGQLGLPELILLRTQVIETQQEYLARLLDAALASVELRRTAGVLE
jgi:cobalt-zinc-cadmium efflux system outer membrane protein